MIDINNYYPFQLGYEKLLIELTFTPLGLRAAEMTALPPSIIQEAKTVASKVSQQLLVCLLCVFVL